MNNYFIYIAKNFKLKNIFYSCFTTIGYSHIMRSWVFSKIKLFIFQDHQQFSLSKTSKAGVEKKYLTHHQRNRIYRPKSLETVEIEKF